MPAFKSMIQSRFGVLTSEIALLSLQSQHGMKLRLEAAFVKKIKQTTLKILFAIRFLKITDP